MRVAVAKMTSDGNAVTVQRSGSDTINGATSQSITGQYEVWNFLLDQDDGQWLATGGAATGLSGGDGIDYSAGTISVDLSATPFLEISGGKLQAMAKDEDGMTSDSDTHLATQQSIKKYVDDEVAGAGGGFQSVQTFTSSGTWTKPTGITKVMVELTGGGAGGGGGHPSTNYDGSGGGAGGYSRKFIDVSAISSETVTIGSGGSGGGTATNGSNGGTTSFGSHCSATGGTGGDNCNYNYGGGAAGTGSSGDLNAPGGQGRSKDRASTHDNCAGSGGASHFAGGGRARGDDNKAAGGTGTYGSGGAGGSDGYAGGAGGAGVVFVWEYA